MNLDFWDATCITWKMGLALMMVDPKRSRGVRVSTYRLTTNWSSEWIIRSNITFTLQLQLNSFNADALRGPNALRLMKGTFMHVALFFNICCLLILLDTWNFVTYSWKPTTEYEHYNGPDYGWCWLDNLYSRTNLASYCYDDVHYDHRHGRFYSSKACNPDEDPKDKE